MAPPAAAAAAAAADLGFLRLGTGAELGFTDYITIFGDQIYVPLGTQSLKSHICGAVSCFIRMKLMCSCVLQFELLLMDVTGSDLRRKRRRLERARPVFSAVPLGDAAVVIMPLSSKG